MGSGKTAQTIIAIFGVLVCYQWEHMTWLIICNTLRTIPLFVWASARENLSSGFLIMSAQLQVQARIIETLSVAIYTIVFSRELITKTLIRLY